MKLVIGLDLSGPVNVADTALAAFRVRRSRLHLLDCVSGIDDHGILDHVHRWNAEGEVIVGLDAPLSYQPGGGDRPGDRRLRTALVEMGLPPGTVMAPTLTRMAYLTLRGFAVARLLQSLSPRTPKLVEVHPGGAIALRGGPVAVLRQLKQEQTARRELLSWLATQGVSAENPLLTPNAHVVAAYAAALAAWQWSQGRSVWLERADPPLHPFDFVC